MPGSLSASEYILDNFRSSDRVAVLLRNHASGEVIQRIAPAEKIACHDFQKWPANRNQAGFDIYIGMNTVKEGAYSRTKRDIDQIQPRLSRLGLQKSGDPQDEQYSWHGSGATP